MEDEETRNEKLNDCMKKIAELLVDGAIDPGNAVFLYIRAVNRIHYEKDDAGALFMYPIYYGRFCAYLAAWNLKLTACGLNLRIGRPKSNNIDELFNEFIKPIIETGRK